MDNEIANLFLSFSCRRLDLLAANMKACLDKLSDEQVWARGGAHENAVGNLVLHLCGNIRQWMIHGIGGVKDVRVREVEFSTEGGPGRAALSEMFSSTVTEARDVVSSLPVERLTERTAPQPGRPEVSVLEAIYQTVSHAHEHVGQVIVLTKQMTGTRSGSDNAAAAVKKADNAGYQERFALRMLTFNHSSSLKKRLLSGTFRLFCRRRIIEDCPAAN